jgi:hypothetical protein
MSLAQDLERKKEFEKKVIEAASAECQRLVEAMRMALPEEFERLRPRLDETIRRCPKLPIPFKRRMFNAARHYECTANTRAADRSLNEALSRARSDDVQERNRLVGEARRYANMATRLGADTGFRTTLNRKIEIILMTGGVEHKGPTIAKPLDTAPKIPNIAKQ